MNILKKLKEELPQHVLDILSPSSPLAGGAILAMLHGYEVKDYDIFCNPIDADSISCRLLDLGYEEEVITCEYIGGEPCEGIVAKYTLDDSKPIELISTHAFSSPLGLIKDFDLSCCCIAFDGECMILDQRYLEDILDKKITVLTVDRISRTLKRVEKYKEKGFDTSNVEHSILRLQSDLVIGADLTLEGEDTWP